MSLALLAGMPLVLLFVLIGGIGLVAWAIVTYVPMPAEIKKLIIVLAIAVALGLVLQACGILDYIRGVEVPHV